MTISPIHDELEKDGIVYPLAEACSQAIHELAAAATARQFVRLAALQAACSGELTPEHVAAHLHTILKSLTVSVAELKA
jgi:hypothetical protein